MKYMGSKKSMLKNGLGDLLIKEVPSRNRFVDLFCGSGSVSWFVATNLPVPTLACDLQLFATILAGTVIKRTQPSTEDDVRRAWLARVEILRSQLNEWQSAFELDSCISHPSRSISAISRWHRLAQKLCSIQTTSDAPLIFRSYGGHYFSPSQALTLDAMIMALPADPDLRELCLAATIFVASRCAAAPGHTAQPFKATRTASKFLRESWIRDPIEEALRAIRFLCPLHAKSNQGGCTQVGNANVIAKELTSEDIVFVDPPYSAVQYSRFYHVLETIARGTCGKVEGVGRYPPFEERPNSSYSKRGTSSDAIKGLLRSLSERGCKVVLTFPYNLCSNGLSGVNILQISKELFRVEHKIISSRFSTLGGNTRNRDARKISNELILVLDSK